MNTDNHKGAANLLLDKKSSLVVMYSELIQMAGDCIHILDEHGNVLEANALFCDMLGHSREDMLQLNVADWDVQWTYPELKVLISELIKKAAVIETRCRCKNGTILDVEMNASGIVLGGRDYLFLISRNITQRKRVDEDINNSETRYRRLFETARDGILLLDVATGMITDVNPFLIKLLGYSKEQLIEKQIWDIGLLKDIIANKEKFLELQLQQYVRYENLPLMTLDGRKINVEFVSNVYLEGTKEVIQCNIRDITERKAAEAALDISEKRYRGLLNNLDAGVIFYAPDTTVLMSNPKACELFGLSGNEMTGTLSGDLPVKYITEQNSQLTIDDHPLHRIIATRQSVNNIVFGIIKAGKMGVTWLSVNGFPVLNSKNEIVEVLISFIDITKHKEEEALKNEAVDRLVEIAGMLPGVIYQYRINPDGSSSFPYANEALSKIAGVSRGEVLKDASKIWENIHPDDYAGVAASILESAKSLSLWQHEYRIKLDNGLIRTMYGSSMPHREKDGATVWNGFTSDITELKTKDEKIRQLSKAVEQSPVSIVITDTDGAITYVNRKFVDLTGYSLEEAIGKNPRILKSDKNQCASYKHLWTTIKSGGEWRGEFYNKKRNGEFYWEAALISPILNEQGVITHFLAIKEDITDRKIAEKKLIRNADELRISNADLQNFAFIASHDLQEPLRMVNSFLTLIEKKLADKLDETTIKYIHFAVDGTERMKALINDLLLYSRVGTNKEKFASIELMDVLQYCIQVLKDTIDEKMAVIKVLPLPVIIANKTLMGELFTNLLSNALKYNKQVKPVVEVGYTEENDRYIIYVKDNGIGINASYFDKIFIIFQRLHVRNEYTGTGIGLAISKKIVETHNGKIWVESEEDKGTTFYCSFPKQME